MNINEFRDHLSLLTDSFCEPARDPRCSPDCSEMLRFFSYLQSVITFEANDLIIDAVRRCITYITDESAGYTWVTHRGWHATYKFVTDLQTLLALHEHTTTSDL